MIKVESQKVFLTKKEDIKYEKYRNFDTDKAAIALIVTDNQNTPMEAGIFNFNTSFDYTVEADEVIYVLKGCLVISHEEKEYKAYRGDYIFLKKGTRAYWRCEGETEYFYATYPIYDIE
jgi:ethanolamine utilization protein EutQ